MALKHLQTELAKWMQTIQMRWSVRMAYKLHFLLLILGPTLVFFFVKYNLWHSIYTMSEVREIQGYNFQSMLSYQVWVMVVSFLAQSYNAMNLSIDIRLGRISAYLLYPFDFWKFHTSDFLSLQSLQLLVAGFTVFFATLAGWIHWNSWQPYMAGLCFTLLVSCFWFVVSSTLSLLAFWLEETWVLRVMFLTVSSFLSGAILPLEIYPSGLQTLLGYTPFPYITFVPAKIFMGEYQGSIPLASCIILAWTILSIYIAKTLWKRGIRLYTASGM